MFGEQPIRETASELRLSHVIQGSVLKSSSNRFRVIVNLVHVADGTQLWAREYDFATSEVLDFQSGITTDVLHLVKEYFGRRSPQSVQFAQAA